MQKKLIALAVTAAFSTSAFADASVYGIVDAAVANIKTTDMAGHTTVLSGGLSTSRIGVVAAEDLDNGMKAIAKVEYKLDVAGGTAAAPATVGKGDGILEARQEMLALAGGFGTVAAGFLQTTGLDFTVKFNPVAGSAVDSLGAVNIGTLIQVGSRATHALAYISPDLGGVTVAYNRSFDAGNQNNSESGVITANLLSATYSAGPLAVGGVFAGGEVKDTGKITEMALGASYDLGVVKLLGTYQNYKLDLDAASGEKTNTAMSFSVVAPVGSGAVVGSVAKNDVKNTAGDDNSTSMTVAYLQGLSKTTTAYGAVQVASTENAAGTVLNPKDEKTTVIAVGVKKTF